MINQISAGQSLLLRAMRQVKLMAKSSMIGSALGLVTTIPLYYFYGTKGIGTLIHYPIPPHLQEAYESLGLKKGDFPIAEELADTCLSLPVWPGMSKDEVKTVAQFISNYYNERR